MIILIGIIQFLFPFFQNTSMNSITKYNDNDKYYWQLLLLFGIPYHLQIWLTNFILFIWLKIYYSIGVTDGWLQKLRKLILILTSISLIILILSTIYISIFQETQDSITLLLFQIGMLYVYIHFVRPYV